VWVPDRGEEGSIGNGRRETPRSVRPPQVFLSYAREDAKQADRLRHLLAANDVRVWSDADISPGTSWREQIDDALRSADAVLVLVSPASVNSSHVHSEVAAAVAARMTDPTRLVVPVRTDPRVELPPLLQDVQALELAGTAEDVRAQLEALAERLRSHDARSTRNPAKSLELVDLESAGLLLEREAYHRTRMEQEHLRVLRFGQLLAFALMSAVLGLAALLVDRGHAAEGTTLAMAVVVIPVSLYLVERRKT
jgi:hypothetical protein